MIKFELSSEYWYFGKLVYIPGSWTFLQYLETFLTRLVGIINACGFFDTVITFGKPAQLREPIFSERPMLDVTR